jgi:hypothetical protein
MDEPAGLNFKEQKRQDQLLTDPGFWRRSRLQYQESVDDDYVKESN